MDLSEVAERIGPELTGAMQKRGFTSLTRVQEAVLEPGVEGRDLRISSQTGSGKTIALGLAVRDIVTDEAEPANGRDARPRVLVVVPTRELAKQVHEELGWLYAPLRVRVASVTGGGGGGGYREELRAFRTGPAVVVGTPGRLRDHLERGAVDASNVAAVVLDEADQMLDLGFREDIEAIFGKLPEEHRSHLVSATFPREVESLANKVQTNPAYVEGSPRGEANQDIEHLVHLVRRDERLAAIINLLLASPGSQTLIFARTRADVSEITASLLEEGFVVGMLSGEMEQPERLRALAAFKSGHLDALVATDVAARGIDVADIARVIHAEPPGDPDAYTHRSGRTGRAGRKGTSSVLVTPPELVKTTRLLARARVRHRLEPIPSDDAIRAARDERLYGELVGTEGSGHDPASTRGPEPDDRAIALAERIAKSDDLVRVLARLVAHARGRSVEPRKLTVVDPPASTRRLSNLPVPPRAQRVREERNPRDHEPSAGWVPFRVSWGQVHGADARRLVAMLCRRGGIQGGQIGAIRVGRTSSLVEVAAPVADSFERAASEPDPRDRKVVIRRWQDEAPPSRMHDAPPPRMHDAPPSRMHDAPPPRTHDAPPSRMHDAPPPRMHDAPRPHAPPHPRATLEGDPRPHREVRDMRADRKSAGHGPPDRKSAGHGPPDRKSAGHGPPDRKPVAHGPPDRKPAGHGPPDRKPGGGHGPPKRKPRRP